MNRFHSWVAGAMGVLFFAATLAAQGQQQQGQGGQAAPAQGQGQRQGAPPAGRQRADRARAAAPPQVVPVAAADAGS
jgi:hypothetical protein